MLSRLKPAPLLHVHESDTPELGITDGHDFQYTAPPELECRHEWQAFRSFRDALTVGWQVRARQCRVELLFLGDSLTEHWIHPAGGRQSFVDAFAQWHPAAFGVGGDRVAHLRWRIAQGMLTGFSPRVTVLCIGTNQLSHAYAARRTVAGICDAARDVLHCLPDTHLVLCGILPSNPGWDWDVLAKIATINAALGSAALPRTSFVDPSVAFLDRGAPRGSLFTDGIHLTRAGYRTWASVLRPHIARWFADAPATRSSRIPGPSPLRLVVRDWNDRIRRRGA